MGPLRHTSAQQLVSQGLHPYHKKCKKCTGTWNSAEDLQRTCRPDLPPKSKSNPQTCNTSQPRGTFHCNNFPQRHPVCTPCDSPFGDPLVSLKLTAESSQGLSHWFQLHWLKIWKLYFHRHLGSVLQCKMSPSFNFWNQKCSALPRICYKSHIA